MGPAHGFISLAHWSPCWLSQSQVQAALEEVGRGLRQDHVGHGDLVVGIWWPDPSRILREAQEQK